MAPRVLWSRPSITRFPRSSVESRVLRLQWGQGRAGRMMEPSSPRSSPSIQLRRPLASSIGTASLASLPLRSYTKSESGPAALERHGDIGHTVHGRQFSRIGGADRRLPCHYRRTMRPRARTGPTGSLVLPGPRLTTPPWVGTVGVPFKLQTCSNVGTSGRHESMGVYPRRCTR